MNVKPNVTFSLIKQKWKIPAGFPDLGEGLTADEVKVLIEKMKNLLH